MLELNNLSVRIQNRTLINNLSFSLDKGILGIIGLNGVGKTTLLKTLAGINDNYSGQIIIKGKSLNQYKRKNLARVISLVPQEHSSYFNFTVKEMVLFGRTPYIQQFGFPLRKDYAVVEKVIQAMGIKHLEDRFYNQLSGGEKRLVLIGMTLAQETQIILFDEPTTFLDLKNAILVISKIKQLANDLMKIVIITMHDINQCILLASQILLLYSATTYDIGSVDMIINNKNLNALYGVDFNILTIDNRKIVIPIIN